MPQEQRTYTAAEIEAGFLRWAEELYANPSAFMPPSEHDAMSPAERAASDTQELLRQIG